MTAKTKRTIYIVCAFLLLAIATIGSTYAFYQATTNSGVNTVATEAHKFEVIYTGGTDIEGPLNLSVDRTGGLNTTVHIQVGEGSVQGLAHLYINLERLDENIRIDAFKWEVSGVKGGREVYTNSGTFAGYDETNNNIVTIVENYRLTEEQTDFTLYIWLDGNAVGNEVMGCGISGHISASTEEITGELS